MKATELRIGNYVDVVNNGMVKLENVHSKGITIGDNQYLISMLKPILLTEEWLIDFGFTFWGGGTSYCDRNDFWAIKMENNSFEIEDLEVCIKHVHQLQNLYFALTNDELKLN